MDQVRSIEEMRRVLTTQGGVALVEYLNNGVPHRYTAVYRQTGSILHNVLFHDKERKRRPAHLALIPYAHSYCQFVVRGGEFRTDDSISDARLLGHPLRTFVMSYHSVPILDSRESFWGTLSHFDVRPLSLPESEYELLRSAAGLLTCTRLLT